MKLVRYGPEAWSLLNGVLCVYKPVDMTVGFLRKVIIGNLCRDLNQLLPRPQSRIVSIEGSVGGELAVQTKENFADHTLVLGPRHQPKDVRVSWVYHCDKNTSGVCVLGVNRGSRMTQVIRSARLIRTYTISGELGQATDTHYHDGKVMEKSKFGHVTRGKMQRALMPTQAAHQRSSLSFLGINLHSQEAYEALSAEGLVRPGEKSPPLLYGINLVDFNPPHFTLEVSCINETGQYLHTLIHDLGITLKTNAVCTQTRCIRYGPWTLQHALLRKHWSLEHIINNMAECRPLVHSITPCSPSLVNLDEREINCDDIKSKG
ncbi:hypothetical protein Pmani_036963 [Petrolisthes manimaculis]|uniref:Pseudouridine synthase II N-terminal domain-containing protein n=1 Tax=Petrolisthes manimaculis TaxID=1843537 RepID=A0AAE1TM51_9EUCA|nr:hypothetical protein Pmani_036963 [Petrolisthes manimaculis]